MIIIPLLSPKLDRLQGKGHNGGSIPEIVGDAGKSFDPRNTNSITEAVVAVTQKKSYADGLRNRDNHQYIVVYFKL